MTMRPDDLPPDVTATHARDEIPATRLAEDATPQAAEGTVAQTPAGQSDSAQLSAVRDSVVPGYEIIERLKHGLPEVLAQGCRASLRERRGAGG